MLYTRIGILFAINLFFNFLFGQIPYSQLVFPKDIHEHNLLFISELEGQPNILNEYVIDFIEKDAQNGFAHKLVTNAESADYSVKDYKYMVIPIYLNIASHNGSSTNYYKKISCFIMDRESTKKYREYAIANNMDVEQINISYPVQNLTPGHMSKFLKDLYKIRKRLREDGAEATFQKEWKKQIFSDKHEDKFYLAMLFCGTVVPLTIGLIADYY